jgi:hypothetical protein
MRPEEQRPSQFLEEAMASLAGVREQLQAIVVIHQRLLNQIGADDLPLAAALLAEMCAAEHLIYALADLRLAMMKPASMTVH